jgi:hypothetical protein
MNQVDLLANIPRLSTIREALNAELVDTIAFYVSEMATLRRIKETTTDPEIEDEITGIIMDELTIIDHYRRELL